jgi:DNA-binding CsgD family transcriptional regulator
MALTAEAIKRIKHERFSRAQDDRDLQELLRRVAAEKHEHVPHEEGAEAEDLLGDWLADRLLGEGKLRMILDRSTTPGELRALARNDIDQYWAGRRRRELLPRLFKRIDRLLRGDPSTFTVLLDAARPGAVCWTLTGQPAKALFSERDYELYSHVSGLNLKTLEESPNANKQTQFLSAAELRRYVIGMLDGCGRALSVDQLARSLQIYYHLESGNEELPDENALPDSDRDTYIANVATHEDHDPPGADASAKANALLETLTLRQRTILEKLLEGVQQREIAAELGVSQGTVSAEKDSIAGAIQQQCPERDNQREMLAATAEILGVSP